MSFTQKDLLNSSNKIDSSIVARKVQEVKLVEAVKKQNKRIKSPDKAGKSGRLI
jgi:hypothetical protein